MNNPILIGGKDRLDTEIIQNTNKIIAKVGACGLCVIVNLENEEAIVIKIADSNMEARKYAAFTALKKWTEGNSVRLNNITRGEIKTLDCDLIGEINSCFSLY